MQGGGAADAGWTETRVGSLGEKLTRSMTRTIKDPLGPVTRACRPHQLHLLGLAEHVGSKAAPSLKDIAA